MLIGISPNAIGDNCLTANLFSPKKITGLKVWLKANAGVLDSSNNPITANNTPVATWLDFSGNANHAVQSNNAKRPLYNTNLLDGKGGLVYDGTDDCLTIANLALYPFISVFLVLKQLNLAKPFLIEHSATANSNNGFYFYGQDFVTANINRSSVLSQGQAANNWPGTTNEVFSLVFRSNPPVAGQCPIVFKTGNSVALNYLTATTPANTLTTDTLNIGSRNNGASVQMNANLHELVIYDAVLDTSNREKIEGYLAWKWGLQANLPVGHAYKNKPPSN